MPRGGVDGHLADVDERVGAAGAAPQGHAHACQQFIGVEGFDQVVVGPLVQAGNAVGHGVAGRHDQHRQVGVGQAHLPRRGGGLAAQALQQVAAVAIGQAQVEQHQVKGLGLQCRPRMGQRGAVVHRIAHAFEHGHQAAGNAGIVFHNQHAHRGKG